MHIESNTTNPIILTNINDIVTANSAVWAVDNNINGGNPIIKDYAFVSIGYAVDKNNEVKFEIDWEWLYGKLPSGNYRILKESHHKNIAVTFSISTNS